MDFENRAQRAEQLNPANTWQLCDAVGISVFGDLGATWWIHPIKEAIERYNLWVLVVDGWLDLDDPRGLFSTFNDSMILLYDSITKSSSFSQLPTDYAVNFRVKLLLLEMQELLLVSLDLPFDPLRYSSCCNSHVAGRVNSCSHLRFHSGKSLTWNCQAEKLQSLTWLLYIAARSVWNWK